MNYYFPFLCFCFSLHFASSFFSLLIGNFLLNGFLLLSRQLLLWRQRLCLLSCGCHCSFRLNLGSSRLLLHTSGSLSSQWIVIGASWLRFQRLHFDWLLHLWCCMGCGRWKIDWVVGGLVCAGVDSRPGFGWFLLFLLDVCEAVNAECHHLLLEVLDQHFCGDLNCVLLTVGDRRRTLAALNYLSSVLCLV